MPAPQIIKTSTGDGSYYRETDLAIHNISDHLKPWYGDIPIIYRLFNSNNQLMKINQSATAPIQNYIFRRVNYSQSFQNTATVVGTDITGIRGNAKVATPVTSLTAFPSVLAVGPDNALSNYCTDTPLSALKSVGVVRGLLTVLTMQGEPAKPRIKRRGYFATAEDGLAALAFATIGQLGTGGFTLDRNASPQDIINAWTTYVAAARNPNEANLDRKTIYVHDSSSFKNADGSSRAIKTFEELKQVFPRLYQFENQLRNSDLIDIAGGTVITHQKSFIDGQWWTYEKTYVGLWDSFAKTGLSDAAINRELIDAGYTAEQIRNIRGIRGLTIYDLQRGETDGGGSSGGGGGSGGGKGGGAQRPDGTTWTGPVGYTPGGIKSITVQRNRNVFLSAAESINALTTSTKISLQKDIPMMYQVYKDGNSEQPQINHFAFMIEPSEVNYANFGGEWVTIERTGTFPFIDWKSFKLLQISFSFTIAARSDIGTGAFSTADGLTISVEKEIEDLQRMAQTPFPVMFYGFDKLFTNQFRYDAQGAVRGIQFVIQDLSISGQRRYRDQQTGQMHITKATASITLQEIPVETNSIIGMPRLKHKPTIPEEDIPETDPEYTVLSKQLSVNPDKKLATPPNT